MIHPRESVATKAHLEFPRIFVLEAGSGIIVHPLLSSSLQASGNMDNPAELDNLADAMIPPYRLLSLEPLSGHLGIHQQPVPWTDTPSQEVHMYNL